MRALVQYPCRCPPFIIFLPFRPLPFPFPFYLFSFLSLSLSLTTHPSSFLFLDTLLFLFPHIIYICLSFAFSSLACSLSHIISHPHNRSLPLVLFSFTSVSFDSFSLFSTFHSPSLYVLLPAYLPTFLPTYPPLTYYFLPTLSLSTSYFSLYTHYLSISLISYSLTFILCNSLIFFLLFLPSLYLSLFLTYLTAAFSHSPPDLHFILSVVFQRKCNNIMIARYRYTSLPSLTH